MLSSLTIGSNIIPEFSTLLSSAYVTSLMFPGGDGMADMYRLNRMGDSTPPCGTPCLAFLYLDVEVSKENICLSTSQVITQESFDISIYRKVVNIAMGDGLTCFLLFSPLSM